jgi:lipopolysaccharide transport system ATP-binding protein
MANIAIRVENLSKMYRIGGKQEKYSTLRDTLMDIATTPYRKIRGLMRGESASGLKEEIWALKDVSFEVKHGEVVGIIGRNGAGKSTLLKILSRITEPTTGYADVYGRVGALLEVGTGFHPELTGRENVYLNGAILGMTRRDIDHKFDEIVDFAGVEKFIDTPVKHYSSGMGLRLGFAVAAHLEPEILVVDEVLAVGDAEFQKKCLGKMQSVANEGRTVLFVSHNMAAVENLCQRASLLERGQLVFDASPPEVIARYLETSESLASESLALRKDRKGIGHFRFVTGQLLDGDLQSISLARSGMDVVLAFDYESRLASLSTVQLALNVRDSYDRVLFRCRTDVINSRFADLPPTGRFHCRLPRLPLMPGWYSVELDSVVNGQLADKVRDAFQFQVIDGDYYNTGRIPPSATFLTDYCWEHTLVARKGDASMNSSHNK